MTKTEWNKKPRVIVAMCRKGCYRAVTHTKGDLCEYPPGVWVCDRCHYANHPEHPPRVVRLGSRHK